MNANQALWEKGDFTRIARTMRISGENLINNVGVDKDVKVLDVGCGDGTTAIPAAMKGARVTGLDIARNLVDAGNKRASDQQLANCEFIHGDASEMSNIPDGSFDLTISIFGAMFCPKPQEVANELVRVTRKGGRIIMGNWIPGDPTLVAQILRICSAYTPPPPEGFVSPMLWGVEDKVRERFANAGIAEDKISFSRETFTFIAPYPPAQFLEDFRNYYGPTMNAFEAAEKNGKADDLHKELLQLFEQENRSADKNKTEIPATYLKVTIRNG